MSAARCSKCKGLLPPWLKAGPDPAHGRCPNCGHPVDLAADGTPAPILQKATDMYPTLAAPQAAPAKQPKQSSMARTMMMGSARPVPPSPPPAVPGDAGGAQKSAALARTMMLGTSPVTPAAAKPPGPPSVTPQRRVATLPQIVAAPVPAATAPATAPASPAETDPEGETLSDLAMDVDVDVDVETPPPAPPSRTSLPSWAIPGAIDDPPTEPDATGPARFLRSPAAKLVAGGVGVIGVIVFATVFITRGGKSDAPVRVETRPAPFETVQAPVAPATPTPSEPPPPAPAPAVAVGKPQPKPRPAPVVAAPRPVAVAASPRPVAVAAPPRPVSVAAPKPAIGAKPVSAAPARAHARAGGIPGLPSEDEQRRAREAYARGSSQLFQGQTEQAMASFKESLKLDPRNPATQRGLGLAYGQAGNAREAIAYLKRYLKASPTASDRALIEKRIDQLSAR